MAYILFVSGETALAVRRKEIDETRWKLAELAIVVFRDLIALEHHFHPRVSSSPPAPSFSPPPPTGATAPLRRYLHNTFNQNSSERRKQKRDKRSR